jgi:hypothetical protein
MDSIKNAKSRPFTKRIYVIIKTESGGREKIKRERITRLTKLYMNMDFLKMKYNLKDEDKIQVMRIFFNGSYRLPFSKNQIYYKGTVKGFIEKATKEARAKSAKRQSKKWNLRI